jgi:hypothetical protein
MKFFHKEAIMNRLRKYSVAVLAVLLPAVAAAQDTLSQQVKNLREQLEQPDVPPLQIGFLAPALREFVMWAGLLIGLAGVVWAIMDASKQKRNAMRYLAGFAAAAIFSNLQRFIAPAANGSDVRLVEFVMLLATLSAIALFLFYVQAHSQEAQSVAAIARHCPQCARPMEEAWQSCPICGWRPMALESPDNLTAPVGTAVQTDDGRQTVVIGKKAYPVYALLVVKEGDEPGNKFPVYDTRTLIGSDSRCQIVIRDEGVSRQHAAIVNRDGKFILTDLASTNGTFVNPKGMDDIPLGAPQVLNDNDLILIGQTKLVYKRVW